MKKCLDDRMLILDHFLQLLLMSWVPVGWFRERRLLLKLPPPQTLKQNYCCYSSNAEIEDHDEEETKMVASVVEELCWFEMNIINFWL